MPARRALCLQDVQEDADEVAALRARAFPEAQVRRWFCAGARCCLSTGSSDQGEEREQSVGVSGEQVSVL